ncbi:hypothetical protein GCM10010394_04720 [Streptomyces crystallinus]|uniref:Uncharacterized protein n=1 Tax=Streptomyces crystallinus TaxID=68191 RepID=A0ABP3Q2Z7_9ACTN
MATPTAVFSNYRSLLEGGPEVTRIIGGMTAVAGMVVRFKHSNGDHIVHYHCEKTDGRQHRAHFDAIPEGYQFLRTERIDGFEYAPVGGGERFADVYRHPQAA